LIISPTITRLAELKGKVVVSREGPSRNTPIAEMFYERTQLRLGSDLTLQLLGSDQEGFDLLMRGEAHAALLPRPFGFIAEDRGFKRVSEWPDVVDDPLPISLETTAKLLDEREQDLTSFLAAHSDGIRYFKSNRAAAIGVLERKFGHSSSMAQRIFDDYVVWMDERMKVDFKQFEKLLSQVAPERAEHGREIASEWVMEGALNE
jgi:ABC-type nitrate/sulfonate/bicarbonate transport system substrate-binding protein